MGFDCWDVKLNHQQQTKEKTSRKVFFIFLKSCRNVKELLAHPTIARPTTRWFGTLKLITLPLKNKQITHPIWDGPSQLVISQIKIACGIVDKIAAVVRDCSFGLKKKKKKKKKKSKNWFVSTWTQRKNRNKRNVIYPLVGFDPKRDHWEWLLRIDPEVIRWVGYRTFAPHRAPEALSRWRGLNLEEYLSTKKEKNEDKRGIPDKELWIATKDWRRGKLSKQSGKVPVDHNRCQNNKKSLNIHSKKRSNQIIEYWRKKNWPRRVGFYKKNQGEFLQEVPQ